MAGLVLAGGEARRFGSEKALAERGGRPLIAWAAAALQPVCGRVAISAGADSGAAAWAAARDLPVLNDDPAHPRGPLAGLAAGLAWAAAAGYEVLITLPCDVPGVRSDHLTALIEGLGAADAAYVTTDGTPQGLCSVWRTSLGPALSQRLARGDHPSVRRLLSDVGARPVELGEPAAFLNINRPEDLAG